jgi:putative Mn2+ efflux pump MntP
LGIWGMSMANTVADFDIASASSIAQLILSILGIVYLGVKIVNESLNGKVNREGKRLENERANRDLIDDENEKL